MSYWNAFAAKYPSRPFLRLDGGSIFNPGTAESEVVDRWMLEGTARSGLDALNLSASDLPVWQELGDLRVAGYLPKNLLEIPLVTGNVVPKVPNFPAVSRYLIKEYTLAGNPGKPFRVGITGLLSDPEERIPRSDFEIRNPEAAAREVIGELRDKTDLRIILTDMKVGAAISLAATVPEIHLILVSHDYEAVAEPQVIGKTLVLLSVKEGRALTEIRVMVDPVTFAKKFQARFVALDGTVPDDPAMGQLQRDARAAIDALKQPKS